jgi:hypothetical protein
MSSKSLHHLVAIVSAVVIGMVSPPSNAQTGCTGRSLSDAARATPAGLDAADWSDIREAYAASRYAPKEVEGGYDAGNPQQRWLTHFDGRGFTVHPDAAAWSWGLELKGYGFPGQERTISDVADVHVTDERVQYDWDEILSEWYTNMGHGLEHGYTLRRRPAHYWDGPLTLALTVRGDLVGQLQRDGRGAVFTTDEGVAVLTYAGLFVVDVDGRVLPAHLELSPTGLLVSVDDRGAHYPISVDPMVQQAYLKASNSDANDNFGWSVSVSGDTVVVGAPNEASAATGVNGDQSDESAPGAGAAYVFVRTGSTWSQQAYLKASNTEAGDDFGSTVSSFGDTVVVGASGEDSGASGVNGDGTDNSAINAGATYVFVRTGANWSQQAYLKASNTEEGDEFGSSVLISDDLIVVGAIGESSGATGVNGDQDDNSASGSGAAYVFVRSGTTWSQQAYLKASNTDPTTLDYFGWSVACSGESVVVGALLEASTATGVNGDQFNNGAPEAGAAYVFVRNGGVWSQQAYLKASNTGAGDNFGGAVAISGDTIVVGAIGEDSFASGINGNQADNSAMVAGAAYVFTRTLGTWTQQAYLKSSNPWTQDIFGASVGVSGDTVVVGAWGEDSAATGVNGNQSDESAPVSGAAYVFVRSGSMWSQLAYVKSSNTGAFDELGRSVAVADETVIAGAWLEDSAASLVNGDQGDNNASGAGAAYVFHIVQNPWTSAGSGLAGVAGVPTLVGTGSLRKGSAGSLTLSNAAPSALAVLFVSLSSVPSPFKCGTLVPVPISFQLPLITSGAGGISLPWASWPGGLSGLTLYFQYAIQDAAAVCGVAISTAERADVD